MGLDIFNGAFLVSKVSSSKDLELVAKSQLHIWILNFVAINSHVTFPATTMGWFSALLYQAGMFSIFFLYIQLKAFPPENSALHSLLKQSMRDVSQKSKSCLSLGQIMKEHPSSAPLLLRLLLKVWIHWPIVNTCPHVQLIRRSLVMRKVFFFFCVERWVYFLSGKR